MSIRRGLSVLRARLSSAVTEPHYVRDYARLVRGLLAEHPRGEAMALAVGGRYDDIGRVEADLLVECGLAEGHAILDIGCGSGRLAHQLGKRFRRLDYLGIDVVQELLDFAAEQSPPDYRYRLNTALSVPCADASLDVACAFSVFTHLHHAESFRYLADTRRALQPGGKMVFSFLEAPRHLDIFVLFVEQSRTGTAQHLNILIERPMIEAWAAHLGFVVEGYREGPPLGQSAVIMRVPERLAG